MGYSFGDFMGDITTPIRAVTGAAGGLLGGGGGGGLLGGGGGGGLIGGALDLTGLPQLAMKGFILFIGIEVFFKLLDKIL